MSIDRRLRALERRRRQQQEASCCRCVVLAHGDDFEPDEHGCCKKCGHQRRGKHVVVTEEIVTRNEAGEQVVYSYDAS